MTSSVPPCPDCGGRGVKYGHRYRKGGPIQQYICTVCGCNYTENTIKRNRAEKRAAKDDIIILEPATPAPEAKTETTVSTGTTAIKTPEIDIVPPDEQDRKQAEYLASLVKKEQAAAEKKGDE
jgi:hypothetical protein